MRRFLLWFVVGLLIGAGGAAGYHYLLQAPAPVEQAQSARGSESDTEEEAIWPPPPVLADSASYPRRGELSSEVATERQTAITRAIEKGSPAVVGILVTQLRRYRRNSNPWFRDPFFDYFYGSQQQQQQAIQEFGSGFIMTPDGYVVTNEHVVHNAADIKVQMAEGKEYEAEIIGTDFDSDLALLKIKTEEEVAFPWIPICPSDEVIVGEWAIAIGNPFGLFQLSSQPSVSVGVVSASGLSWQRKSDGRLYSDMIQTDAAINPGNSGGPLLNAMGHVIGVNTFIYTPGGSGGSVGVGFAIPARTLRERIAQLKQREGAASDFWTGLTVQKIDPWMARMYGFPVARGALVAEVEENSPGSHAGIKSGDILVEIEQIPVTNADAILQYFKNHDMRVGDKLHLKLIRNGQEKDVVMILEAIPRD